MAASSIKAAPPAATAARTDVPPRDVALALLVVAIWGSSFVPVRWALDEVPPLALAALRFLLAGFPAALLVRRPEAPWWLVAAYGCAIGVGQYGITFIAIGLGMPGGLASLVIQAQVLLTILLAALLLRDPLHARQVAGVLVAAGGLAMLAWMKLRMGAAATAVGVGLTLLAALAWAVGNVLAKHAAKRRAPESAPLDMFSLVVWSSLAAPLPLLALSFAFEGGWAPLHAIGAMSLRGWLSTLFMSGVATIFGFATWNRLLHKHSTGSVAPFALLISIFGFGSTWLFLGEEMGPADVLASLVVLAGLAIVVWPRRA